MSAATAAVLERAADLIVEHGWWDGGPEGDCTGDRSYCVLTAIAAVAKKDFTHYRQRGEATETFRRYVYGEGDDRPSVARWNDAQPDGETVVAALRACAAQMRAAQ